MKRRFASAPGAAASGGPAATGDHLPGVGDEEASTEELVRRAADGHVVGLSGLSEMMRAEPAAPGGRSMPVPPAGRPVSSPATSSQSRRNARQRALRRNSRVVYALFGGLALVMAAIGVALWWVMTAGPVELNPVNPTDSKRPPTVQVNESLPLLYAQPMRIKPWQPIDGPHVPQDESTDAWLVDRAHLFTGAAEQYFTASIVSTSDDIIVDATLHIVLVNADGEGIVRTQLPVALFSDLHRLRVRVPLLGGLPSDFQLDAWVDVERRLTGGVYLTDTTLAMVAGESTRQVRVSALNDSDQILENLVFLITAADERDRPLARWRVDLIENVEPGERVELRVMLPGYDTEPHHWIVDAAGS